MDQQQQLEHYTNLFNAEHFKNEVLQHTIKELNNKIYLLSSQLKHKDKFIKQQNTIIKCFQDGKCSNNKCTYTNSDGDETTIYINRYQK